MTDISIIYRACDATFGVHAKNRFFTNSKTEVSKRCFKSLYDNFHKNNRVKFIVLGDRLSLELKSFFCEYKDVTLIEISLGGKTGLRDSIKELFNVIKKCNTTWIWQQEDDYLFDKNISNQVLDILDNHKTICPVEHENLVVFPTDYSDRYTFKVDRKQRYFLFKGVDSYWREINSTTFSWIYSKEYFNKNLETLEKMFDVCKYKKFDKYVVENLWGNKNTLVVSPIPSFSVHLDSHIFLPPCVDWQKIWDENKC